MQTVGGLLTEMGMGESPMKEETIQAFHNKHGVGNVFNLEWQFPKSYYRFELLFLLKALERLLAVGGKDGVRDDSGLHVMRDIDSDIGTLKTQTYKL